MSGNEETVISPDLDKVFVSLLERVLAALPSSVTVQGPPHKLGRLFEDVEMLGLNQPDELVWRDLVMALYEVALTGVKDGVLVPRTLPTDQVERVFHRRLRVSLTNPDSGWNDEDQALARSFLPRT